MNSWKTQLRILRLILLLNLLPFVQGCDDLHGLYETMGFPLPSFSFTTDSLEWAAFRVVPFVLNVAIIYSAVVWLRRKSVKRFESIAGWQFALCLVGIGIVMKACNGMLFIPVMLVCMAVGAVLGDVSMGVVDCVARLPFLFLLMLCYAIESDPISNPEGNISEHLEEPKEVPPE
ncbi:MAG: hypothetical protein H6824_24150 [Planctomycetaceae bacterium]|nr:hypothetical protein [Planctomycetaceae bacterium]